MKLMILYIKFLFLYLFLSINCQDPCDGNNCITNGLTCSNNGDNICNDECRPKYGDNTKCYLCPSADGNYYIDGNDICQSGCTGDNIIDFSKECTSVSITNLFFKMGNVYYKKCPLYSKSTSTNECKCENKYYIEVVSSRKIYHCLSPTDICPDGKKNYDYGINECYTSDICKTNTHIKKT